jgi:ribonuclease P protein component
VVTEAFILQARPSEAPGTVVRVGFTASRKVGGAVVRNRARRRLKALAARVVAARARPGWDYVLVARGAAVSRPWSAMVGDLEAAFDRLDRAPAP